MEVVILNLGDGKAENENKIQAKATAIRMSANGLSLGIIADSIGFDIETVKKWISD